MLNGLSVSGLILTDAYKPQSFNSGCQFFGTCNLARKETKHSAVIWYLAVTHLEIYFGLCMLVPGVCTEIENLSLDFARKTLAC